MWKEVDRLPQRCKEVVVLVRICRLTHAEAATLLGTSPEVLRDAFRRALPTLERRLGA